MQSDRQLHALKDQLKTVWSAGDYGKMAGPLQQTSEEWLEDQGIRKGQKVLDVACGTGQLAIPAARAGAEVTGIDLAAEWIQQAKERAAEEGLKIQFDVGDVEAMPYADAAFDVVVSLIGAMFAPRPERAVAELLRVCRPGGRIIMGNWTGEGFVGAFFRMVASHVPPPDMPSPLLWGDEAAVRERFAYGVSDLRLRRRKLRFRYPFPPSEIGVYYLINFGPVKTAAGKLDDAGRAALLRDLEKLWSERNSGRAGTTEVDAEILEVVAVRS